MTGELGVGTTRPHAIVRYGLPFDYFDELLRGVETVLDVKRYESSSELEQYCYRVASMVGLICTAVFGTKPHPRARKFAIDMGIGLQITNIMRDVKEDAERGRVYFPLDELKQCGLTPEDILAGVNDDRFRKLMKIQGDRARLHFRSGRRLLPLLDLRSRMCVNTLQGIYYDILTRIEKRDYDVLTERVSLRTAAEQGRDIAERLTGLVRELMQHLKE